MTNKIKKAGGFYVGIVASLLCIISAILYAVNFSSISYKEQIFDSGICIFLCVTAGVSIVLLLVNNLAGFAPVLLCLGSGISFLLYIKMMIWPISDTIYGIEPFAHMNEIIICAVLLVASFVLSEVSLYMKKSKAIDNQ